MVVGIDQGSEFLAIDWDLDGDADLNGNTTDQIEYAFQNEGTYRSVSGT